MNASELREKISQYRTDKYRKFTLAFEIIKLASSEAFEEAYGSTSNFLFEVNSQGQPFSPSSDERGMYNKTSFNQIIKSQNRSKTIKYKLDNLNSAKY